MGLAGRDAGHQEARGCPHVKALYGWQRPGQCSCYMGAVGTESVSFLLNTYLCFPGVKCTYYKTYCLIFVSGQFSGVQYIHFVL